MPELSRQKLDAVFHVLSESSPVIVAFSGGVDSTLLLKLALDHLGAQSVLAVTGVSPSIPASEQAEAANLAKKLGAHFMTLPTQEMDNPNYRDNPRNRCFYCKEELFTRLTQLARQKNYRTVVDGTNADDAHDWRPGIQAARQLKVRSPLLEADLSKQEIRALSQQLNLPTWNKPAMPCLSSRVPYGEPITIERLQRIESAEEVLRNLGFQEVRVRDHFPVARIEVSLPELHRLVQEPVRAVLVKALKSAGYRYITADLAGFTSGSLNPSLAKP